MFKITRVFAALAVITFAVASLQAKTNRNVYIVRMIEAPVVDYKGDVPGFAATKPEKGKKIDPNSSAVVSYQQYLVGRHDNALNSAKSGLKVYDYTITLNGFAAELTPEQAEALKSAPGVVSVTQDEIVEADTSSTPAFIGLTAGGGLWEKVGGVGRAGEDIIIGVIDSGIWPESDSFSDRTGTNGNGTQDGKLSYQQIPGWHGKCVPGEQFTASNCNQKLIGARHYNVGFFGGDAGLKAARPWEFASARDYNGHGTHTSSTAGGNHGVTSDAIALFGSTSGIAPRARIAMYKALWHVLATGSSNGANSDLIAAIDQAVADGVDVINYSVSGSQTNYADPVEIAFLNAANAGIFVATSAGNNGPTSSTVAHPGPWLTTVAASTHDRISQGRVTLGSSPSPFIGASVAPRPVTASLIDSTQAGLPGANATAVSLCFSAFWNGGAAVLDPLKVANKIVLCDRGTNDRVDKSRAVREAGGIGMILVNVTANTIVADFHSIPSVHLHHTDRAALKAYAATTNPTATVEGALVTVAAPVIAGFSSRGPLRAGNGDTLKPDVTAPGVDVLASVAPPGNLGLSFSLYQGTSMSTPHVAGLAALFKNLYPNWSPMRIKSALMTTGYDVIDTAAGGAPLADATRIFRQGAGHVKPNSAMDPGLVFDSNVNDWVAFLCGASTAVPAATCTSLASAGFSLDRSDMNTASIAIGDMLVRQTVKRRVTNVGNARATYVPTVSGMTGFTVGAPTLTLEAGETKSFNVSFFRPAASTTAPLNSFTGGQINWTDGTHNVRVPLVIRPQALVAPAELSGNGSPINYGVGFGYAGPFTATPRGLIKPEIRTGSVVDDPANNFVPVASAHTLAFPVTIPAGTSFARFSLFNSDVPAGTDLDMNLYQGTTQLATSGIGGSDEQIDFPNPPAGNYIVYVHGFEVAGTVDVKLFQWVLGTSSAGNTTVTAPAAANATDAGPGTGSINLSFAGLEPNTRYFGSIAYSGNPGTAPTPTLVRVNTP